MVYEINININGGSTESENLIAGDKTEASTPKDETTKKKGLATFVASQAVKPFLQSAINYVASNVELSTGSTGLQQQVDFAMQSVDTVTGAVSTIGAGASIGGPVGAVVGAVVAVAQIGVNYALKQAQINLQKQVEDRQISYLRNRAGASFNLSRSGI